MADPADSLPSSIAFASGSPAATVALGRALGRAVEPGLVVALSGPLGAGKTAFVRGLADGLGVPDPRAVASPTYVLLQEHAGRCPLYHYDAYRLAGPAAFAALGPEEGFDDGVTAVEWADKVVDVLPAERLEIDILSAGGDEDRRFLAATAFGERPRRCLARWQALAGPPADEES